tara:strand:- start:4173 stop:4517 length:345 start_codon:yes stop_codon:yes gene_type:complete
MEAEDDNNIISTSKVAELDMKCDERDLSKKRGACSSSEDEDESMDGHGFDEKKRREEHIHDLTLKVLTYGEINRVPLCIASSGERAWARKREPPHSLGWLGFLSSLLCYDWTIF